jgi:hypothetical protein
MFTSDYNNMTNKVLISLIIGLIIGLVVGGIASYFIFNNQPRRGNFNNFQLTESQVNEIITFFNSNPNSTEIQSYCQQNKNYCFYYCRDMNQSNEICKNMALGGNQFPKENQ